jgi:hypothetical protein
VTRRAIEVVRRIDWDTPVPLNDEALAWLRSLRISQQFPELAKLLEHVDWQAREIARLRAERGLPGTETEP